jgi:hypothetical protein
MPTLDELADPILAPLVDDLGGAVGTAFRVIPDGTFLTCHHCVRDGGPVRLRGPDGEVVTAVCSAGDRLPAVDLAVLHCPELTGPAVPLVRTRGLDRFWTKGFGWQSNNVRGAMPREGLAQGRVALRYAVGEDEYELPAALVLGEQAPFDGGLSGSPLFDSDEQVVVGVVTTKYKGKAAAEGFGVPFDDAAARSEAIARLLEINRRRVPCFGRHLNAPAAREICRRQRERAISVLATSGRALPESYVARAGLDDAVDAFLDGDRQVLPVIGASGVGKTAALTALAEAARADVQAVLVEGSSLRRDDRGLADALKQLGEDPERLVGALAEEGDTLLVLLDAINEAPRDVRAALGPWWGETAVWLDGRAVKLILTSREDFWTFASRHVAARLTGDVKVELGDFDEDEAARGIATYGLAGRGLRPRDARHPFVLRIYSELDATRSLSRYQAVTRYIEMKSQAIAEATGGEVGVARVERVLRRIALATASSGGTHLPEELLAEACADVPQLEERLLSENVLTRVASGDVSFAFDQVPELLVALAGESDPAAVAEGALATARDVAPEKGWMSGLGRHLYAYLRLEEQDPDGFRIAVGRLVDELRGVDRRDELDRFWRLHLLLGEILEAAASPVALTDELVQYAEVLHEQQSMSGVFVRTLRTIALPLEPRMRVLQALVPALGDWGNRPKDWTPHGAGYRDELSPLSLLAASIDEDARRTFELMRPWLSDKTRLDGGEATVADVATNVLCHHVERIPPDLLDELASGSADELSAVRTMVERVPTVAVELAARADAPTALALVPAALRPDVPDDVRTALLETARRLYRDADRDDVRDTAFGVLLAARETVEDVLDDALEQLDHDASANLGGFYTALRVQPGRVFAALMARARSHPDETSEILSIVRNESLSDEQTDERLALAEDARAQGALEPWQLAMVVEYRLYKLRDEPPTKRLAALARELYAGDDDRVRRMIGYFVESEDQPGAGARAFRRELAALSRRA